MDEGGWYQVTEIQFVYGLHRLLGFLSLLPFVHDFAELARVFAVEGPGNGLVKVTLLRIGDDHTHPSHGLQHCPVQADGANQRQNHQQFG